MLLLSKIHFFFGMDSVTATQFPKIKTWKSSLAFLLHLFAYLVAKSYWFFLPNICKIFPLPSFHHFSLWHHQPLCLLQEVALTWSSLLPGSHFSFTLLLPSSIYTAQLIIVLISLKPFHYSLILAFSVTTPVIAASSLHPSVLYLQQKLLDSSHKLWISNL